MPAVHAIPGSGKTYAVRHLGASGWLLDSKRNAPRTFWLRPGQFLSDIQVIADEDYEALNRAAARRFTP